MKNNTIETRNQINKSFIAALINAAAREPQITPLNSVPPLRDPRQPNAHHQPRDG